VNKPFDTDALMAEVARLAPEPATR
jgi:hypothetical protein